MHVAVKEHRSSRPANQLAVISIEPLYPHSVSTGEIIGMTHLSAGHNVALSQLKRAEELSGLACENVRATLLLHVPSPTSTQTSQLVLIERTTQDELSATSLAPNNGGNRRQFTGEVFE
ncbi:hypothetical protein F511_33568 [Dorcoceras hygrometricum]|uniref:Uncharacterized protein n=1 Tax=Dorcoceras hygrometricum TaxID=472368 RepID=A0A2Z7BR51_9LAMI|nr:hypothetical protein F511_33568 [Dorcoceras hygrometricum]